jgi:hypothetical protein
LASKEENFFSKSGIPWITLQTNALLNPKGTEVVITCFIFEETFDENLFSIRWINEAPLAKYFFYKYCFLSFSSFFQPSSKIRVSNSNWLG